MNWELVQQISQSGGWGVAAVLAYVVRRLYLDWKAREKEIAKKDAEIAELLEARNQQLLDITRECVEHFGDVKHQTEETKELRTSINAAMVELRATIAKKSP